MNLDAATLHWPHDRVHVRMLQQAHADHIESLYHAMAAVCGNSAGVHIETVGRVRTFIAEGRRLENRAIFLGDESPDEIDAVLAHFARHRSNLVVEVNPANYYVNPPATWEKRLLRHLLSRGCCIDDFRCVWCCTALDGVEAPTTDRLRRFGADQTDEFF